MLEIIISMVIQLFLGQLHIKSNFLLGHRRDINALHLVIDGYVTLPGGFLLEWGKRTGGAQTFTFPKSFSDMPYFLSVMMIAAPTSSVIIDKWITPNSMTSTRVRIGFKWISTAESGSDIAEDWVWMAFGKAP